MAARRATGVSGRAHPAPRGAKARAVAREPNPLRKAAMIIGPGFITGSSDDDPSGIGTYAVAGAAFGPAMLWTALATMPLMAAVQNVCARLAMTTGRGLAGILREHYPRPLLYAAVSILFVANTINVGADLGAIADAVHVVIGVEAVWLVVPAAVLILVLQLAGSYRLIANTFKWLTVALLAYVADALIVRPNLLETLRATIVPTVRLEPAFLMTLVAILGTTISPYLFFWQSSQEVEEEIEMGRRSVRDRRGASPAELRYATIDTNTGIAYSNAVMFFIILATAMTLFAAGKTDVRSAADAAEALRPLAGDLAGVVFAVGMIGAGFLAVPILSGSAAYAVAEAFGWRRGLNERWYRAKPFYAVIVVATLLGTAMNFVGIDPIDALYWSAVLNGVVAPPLLVVIMLAARSRTVMGGQRIGPTLTILGWAATAAMWLALVALVASAFAHI